MSRFNNKNDGVLSSMEMHRTGNKVIYWVIFAVLFMIGLICLLPPLWIFISSMKTTKELLQIPAVLFPSQVSFHKYAEVWKIVDYSKYYINTIMIAAGSVFFAVIFNGIAGYVLSSLKPRGTVAILTAILWTMLLPNTLSMVPLFKNMIDFPLFGFNLSNTFWPMLLCSGASAFNVLLFKDAFDNLPVSLVEAARLDGCSRIGVFRRIILPLSKPIISVVSIFTVNGAWGDFLLPYLILSDRNKQTVMIQIYNTQSSKTFPIDQQLISLVFAIIPPILIFFFFQRFIMGGATLGGVKE